MVSPRACGRPLRPAPCPAFAVALAAALLLACGDSDGQRPGGPRGSICDGAYSFAASLVTSAVPCAPADCTAEDSSFSCERDSSLRLVLAPYEPLDGGGGRVCTHFSGSSCSPCVPTSCAVLDGGVICSQDCSRTATTCFELSLDKEAFEAVCGS